MGGCCLGFLFGEKAVEQSGGAGSDTPVPST